MNFSTPDLPAISNIVIVAAAEGTFTKPLTALALIPATYATWRFDTIRSRSESDTADWAPS